MATRNNLYDENAINPIAIALMNLKTPTDKPKRSRYSSKKERLPIMIEAGVIQINKVNTASGMPPRL